MQIDKALNLQSLMLFFDVIISSLKLTNLENPAKEVPAQKFCSNQRKNLSYFPPKI